MAFVQISWLRAILIGFSWTIAKFAAIIYYIEVAAAEYCSKVADTAYYIKVAAIINCIITRCYIDLVLVAVGIACQTAFLFFINNNKNVINKIIFKFEKNYLNIVNKF